MQRLLRVLFAFAFAVCYCTPAGAQTTGKIAGEVLDTSGAPIAAAAVVLSGPQHAATKSDSSGAFEFSNLAPGTYAVTVNKGGYEQGGVSAIAVAGANVSVVVTLDAATLSSIKQIAHAVASAHGRFNSSEAAQTFIGAPRLENSAQVVQVNHTLDQVPGIVSARSGGTNASVPGAITSPNMRGALDYEKQTLVDGHPLINGRNGDYPIMFVNRFLLDGIELTQGPAASASSINYAIGGSMNFRTAEPTRSPKGDLLVGMDGYGGVYSNARYSGTTPNGRLGYVFDYTTYGTRGPLNGYASQVALPAGSTINGYGTVGSTTSGKPVNGVTGPYPVPNAAANPSNGYVTLVACCQSVSSPFLNRGQLAKLRYALSPVTSATVTYMGLQSQYDNTAASFTQLYSTFAPATGYSNTNGGPLRGSPILLNSATQIPARRLIDSEPVFEAELRTALHNDNIVARFYGAALDRFTVNPLNNPQANYTTGPMTLYGTATIGGVSRVFTGQTATVTIPTPYFQQVEQDQLRGESMEYDHPIASNLISFLYDRTTSLTNAYSITGSKTKPSGNISVAIPGGTRQDFTTYLARGIWELNPKTELTLSNYYNVYRSVYTPAQNPDGSFIFNTSTVSHDDPRIGIAYHPVSNVSLRFAAGSAVAPPYPALLNTLNQTPAQVYTPGATAVTIAQNSGGLLPETSFGYNVGGDWRLPNNAVLSVDAYLTNLHNQFVTTTTAGGQFTPPSASATIPIYITTNANLGNSRFEGVQLTLSKDEPVGIGYLFTGALQRAYAYGLDPAFYATAAGANTTNIGVLPGINYVGDNKPFFNGISNKSEAYSQAYAEVHERYEHGQYVSLGATLYGSNNTYNVPAFLVMNGVYRFPVAEKTTLQLTADNLLGAYAQPYLQYGAGIGAPLATGQVGLRSIVPYGPTVLHLQLEHSF
jgi:Carboxypeptidase regulatory-like domain/TonB-dependent Receptor Plug Domain